MTWLRTIAITAFLSFPLSVASSVRDVAASTNQYGFTLKRLAGSNCEVLADETGKPIIRNKAGIKVFGRGNCPKFYPGTEDLKILIYPDIRISGRIARLYFKKYKVVISRINAEKNNIKFGYAVTLANRTSIPKDID